MPSKLEIPAIMLKQFMLKTAKKAVPEVMHSKAFDQTAFAAALQSVEKAAPRTVLPKSHQDVAKELDIIFNGLQEWPKSTGRPPMPMFTDKVTQSTFGVQEGEDVLNNLMMMRKKFGR